MLAAIGSLDIGAHLGLVVEALGVLKLGKNLVKHVWSQTLLDQGLSCLEELGSIVMID